MHAPADRVGPTAMDGGLPRVSCCLSLFSLQPTNPQPSMLLPPPYFLLRAWNLPFWNFICFALVAVAAFVCVKFLLLGPHRVHSGVGKFFIFFVMLFTFSLMFFRQHNPL